MRTELTPAVAARVSTRLRRAAGRPVERDWGVRVVAADARRMHEMSVALEICRLAEERLSPAELPQLVTVGLEVGR